MSRVSLFLIVGRIVAQLSLVEAGRPACNDPSLTDLLDPERRSLRAVAQAAAELPGGGTAMGAWMHR